MTTSIFIGDFAGSLGQPLSSVKERRRSKFVRPRLGVRLVVVVPAPPGGVRWRKPILLPGILYMTVAEDHVCPAVMQTARPDVRKSQTKICDAPARIRKVFRVIITDCDHVRGHENS